MKVIVNLNNKKFNPLPKTTVTPPPQCNKTHKNTLLSNSASRKRSGCPPPSTMNSRRPSISTCSLKNTVNTSKQTKTHTSYRGLASTSSWSINDAIDPVSLPVNKMLSMSWHQSNRNPSGFGTIAATQRTKTPSMKTRWLASAETSLLTTICNGIMRKDSAAILRSDAARSWITPSEPNKVYWWPHHRINSPKAETMMIKVSSTGTGLKVCLLLNRNSLSSHCSSKLNLRTQLVVHQRILTILKESVNACSRLESAEELILQKRKSVSMKNTKRKPNL